MRLYFQFAAAGFLVVCICVPFLPLHRTLSGLCSLLLLTLSAVLFRKVARDYRELRSAAAALRYSTREKPKKPRRVFVTVVSLPHSIAAQKSRGIHPNRAGPFPMFA